MRSQMTTQTFSLRWGHGFIGLCLLLGCSPDDGNGSFPTFPAGTACEAQHLTQRCDCPGGGQGAQTCDGSGWSACTCTGMDAPPLAGMGGPQAGAGGDAGAGGGDAGAGGSGGGHQNNAMLNIPPGISFDWDVKTPFPDGTCEAGTYVGLFDGIYMPPAAFQAPIPVIGDIRMTLTETGEGEVFEVSGGNLEGNALVVFPFRAQLVGTLDCTTATFTGELRDGSYDVGFGTFYFSGPLEARYDRRTHAFVAGTWTVEEPPLDPANPPLWPAGGSGTWHSALQP